MARQEYQEALTGLRDDVEALAEDVLERLDEGLYALEHGDTELAEAVIEGDAEINDRYLELEGDCIDLFALQQPVASDLRFIAASFKILTDLERVGDLATNLGHYTEAEPPRRVSGVDLAGIGAAAGEMVEDAVRAYVTEDAAACHRIAERDKDIDAECQAASERVVRDLIEGQDTSAAEWPSEGAMDDGSRLLLAIRDLERVADHGVNIAGRTLYLVESDPALIY